MDVVVCLALKECLFFNKNVLFIQKNLKTSNIYVITNRRNFCYITKKYNNIILIDEDKLISSLTFKNVKKRMDENNFKYKQYGWYFQQFLKLGFALSEYAKDEYLVWDADTVPFNSLKLKRDGRYLMQQKWERNEDYFTCIDNLFDAPLKAKYSFISEHMFFNVAIVKEMLAKIQKKKSALTWYEICLDAVNPESRNGFSEFETYGTYCLNYHPEIFELHTLRTFRHCGKIFGIWAKETEIESLKDDLDTGSFEVYDYPISARRRMKQLLYVYCCKFIAKIRIRLLK